MLGLLIADVTFAAFRQRTSVVFRARMRGAMINTDCAGQTVPVIDPATGVIHAAQILSRCWAPQPDLPPYSGDLRMCSSASLIVPFSPSSMRSLK